MGKLILTLDGQELAQYELEKERYTVGRLSDNDIHIDNMAVSGHHALLLNILKDSLLEDLNSTNGTYVNGKLIKKHALQHGDVVTIGHHHLRFIDSQVEGSDQDEFEKTLVIQPGQVSDDRVRAAAQLAPAPSRVAASAAAPAAPKRGPSSAAK